jgi:hypothetical protein
VSSKFQPIGDELVRVSRVRLYGAEFRLCDPRNLYPDEDRVSFVFASVRGEGDDASEHSGVLVQYEDAEQCKLYRNPLIREGAFFLCKSNVHLRYFAEGSMDRLLAFVRPLLHAAAPLLALRGAAGRRQLQPHRSLRS